MTLPRVQPIAPTWHKEPFDDPDWLFEFKYDGFRAICYLEQRRNRLISRNNNVMTRFEALAGQVAAALNIDDAILDGEIITTERADHRDQRGASRRHPRDHWCTSNRTTRGLCPQ